MQEDRLALRAHQWRSLQWQASELDLLGQTHWFRWEDELRKFAVHKQWGSWQEQARMRDAWHVHLSESVKFSY